MQANHNQPNSITDFELAKRYGTDDIGIEVKAIEFSVECGKIQLNIFGLLGFSVEQIKAQAQGRGLYLTIAVIGLAALISELANHIR